MSNAQAAQLADLEEPTPNRERLTVVETTRREPLHECVRTAVRVYLRNMADHDVQGLHRMVMDEVERPLIETVLESTDNNQSLAARILGISRSTLRKKLATYASEGPTPGA